MRQRYAKPTRKTTTITTTTETVEVDDVADDLVEDVVDAVTQAIDTRKHRRAALESFVNSNRKVLTQFANLCEEVGELEGVIKELIGGMGGAGLWQYETVTRKSAPVSNTYDPLLLPVSLLQRPGIIKKLDDKKIDTLLLGELADSAGSIVPARTTSVGKGAVVFSDKVDAHKSVKKLLAGK